MDYTITVNAKFRKLALAWLEKHDPDYEGNLDPPKEEHTPGLGRCGIGATPAADIALTSNVERRIAGAIRKQQRPTSQENRNDDDSDEEEDSRNKAVGLNKRPQPHPGVLQKKKTQDVVKKPSFAQMGQVKSGNGGNGEQGKIIHQKMDIEPIQIDDSDDDFEKPYSSNSSSNPFNGSSSYGGFSSQPRKKKKKIRSRQKNLRKDNRPKDQLPAHLTEETLKGGRVYRDNMAGVARDNSGREVPQQSQQSART